MAQLRKGVYEGKNQLWDTFPGRYMHFGELWDAGKKKWVRMIKGGIIAIAGCLSAVSILILLPFNLFTGILAAIFIAIAGMGYGQVTINWMLLTKVDATGSGLIWSNWKEMGGVDVDTLGDQTGNYFNDKCE